ncbi:Caffeic acid 3-O-methyltransferase [Morella rubra]|uniref:Caffeic acid 3-O-methyltransferase n=1 Tax=Morella rubra TaxID=262757 RepID=A0A6A1W487_9ROSI|nr:Caffeic acid 3-O-methyltransferase [Morella rubra]
MAKNRRGKGRKRQKRMASFDTDTQIPPLQTGEDLAFSKAMELVYGSALLMAMHAAIDLGVFDILASAGPEAKLSAADIAAKMPTENPEAPAMLDRICTLLVHDCVLDYAISIPKCAFADTNWLYCLNPVSEYFVRNQDGVSLAPILTLIQDNVDMDTWSRLKDAVLEGGVPFHRVQGMDAYYKYLGEDARLSQIFNTAMSNHTTIIVKTFLENYDGFEKVKQVVDVGGGIGAALSLITSEYPQIKGINFDLPHVIDCAPRYPRVKHVAGDMFESVPKGDVIILKWILRDWGDEQCLKLLKNCYDALPKDGRVIVMDQFLPIKPGAAGKSSFLLDTLLMTQNLGGKQRKPDEFSRLAREAGFTYSLSDQHFVLDIWVIEFRKISNHEYRSH